MIQIIVLLLAALVTMTGVASCEHKKVTELEVKIEANKMEAQRQLREAKVQGEKDAISSQKDFQTALDSLSADRDRYRNKLRDPGRRDSCPAGTGPAAGVPENQASGSELSDEAGKFLRSEADRADLAATYAEACRKHAIKPSIRAQVNSLRSQP